MQTYVDDERQSPRPSGPRPQGWPETGHLRRRSGSRGLRTRFSPLAPCIWPVSGQSIHHYTADRALARTSAAPALPRGGPKNKLCRRLSSRSSPPIRTAPSEFAASPGESAISPRAQSVRTPGPRYAKSLAPAARVRPIAAIALLLPAEGMWRPGSPTISGWQPAGSPTRSPATSGAADGRRKSVGFRRRRIAAPADGSEALRFGG